MRKLKRKQRFSVGWKRRGAVTTENSQARGDIFLDGVSGGIRFMQQGDKEMQRDYVSVSDTCIRHYTFASVELTGAPT